MSRLLVTAAREAWSWFEELQESGVNITSHAHLKVKKEAIEFSEEPSLEEAADVAIALLGAVFHRGWSRRELAIAMLDKIVVNRERTWVQQADGTYQHA